MAQYQLSLLEDRPADRPKYDPEKSGHDDCWKTVVTTGKHRGKRLGDIETHRLHALWVSVQANPDRRALAEAVRWEIVRRGGRWLDPAR